MTFREILEELDARTGRTDPEYLAGREKFVNEGVRWLQRRFLGDHGNTTIWTATGLIVDGTYSIEMPEDWRPSQHTRIFLLDGTDRTDLKEVPVGNLESPFWDLDDAVEVDLSDLTTKEKPAYYAIRGRSLELRPTANKAYDLELYGRAYLATLAEDDDTNLLTIEAPDAVIFASLRACWLRFEDAGRVALFEKEAAEAIRDWHHDRIEAETITRRPIMETPG